MSYDLYFKAREPASAPDLSALDAYFSQRRHYNVSKQQAIYENDVTGVYFIFDIGNPVSEERSDLAPVSLNLNYFRPHIFGLEAEPEARAFVENFGLLVSDPQVGGMGEGEYSREGFLSGWNQGNEFGYRSIMSQSPNEPRFTLPTAQIEACWRWNLAHDDLQEQLGEDIFVPRFGFFQQGSQIVTGVVWPDAIPTAIPEADILVIPRKTILPKKFFRHPEDWVVAPWAEVKPVLDSFPILAGALPFYGLNYSEPPDSIVSLLRALPPAAERPVSIPTDKVLNAELVAKARGR